MQREREKVKTSEKVGILKMFRISQIVDMYDIVKTSEKIEGCEIIEILEIN